MTGVPERLRKVVGELPETERLPDRDPFQTVRPVREGYVERDGIRSWFAVWGEHGPWLAFAPIFQITHVQMLKATVPYLSQRELRKLQPDLEIGDESWEVDYYYHENPELKRQPFVFLTDFVGGVPVEDDEREAYLCADRNAEDLEHVARYPYLRYKPVETDGAARAARRIAQVLDNRWWAQ